MPETDGVQPLAQVPTGTEYVADTLPELLAKLPDGGTYEYWQVNVTTIHSDPDTDHEGGTIWRAKTVG
jgi:hypothetical protein